MKQSIYVYPGTPPELLRTVALNSRNQISGKSLRKKKHRAGIFPCVDCGKVYKHQPTMYNHRKFECGKEPQFHCPYCAYKATRKTYLRSHMDNRHREQIQLLAE